MAVTITIDNETFEYPESGDSPGWGEESTQTIVKIAEVLNTLKNINDILTTTASVTNNQVSATNVNGLIFNNSEVRAAQIFYSIYRVTNTNELAESGTIDIVYKNNANSWELNRTFVGDAAVTFSVLPSGQVQYQSSSVSGTGYIGTIKFQAKTLPQ